MQRIKTRSEAVAARRRDIHLGFCRACGLITNLLFDSDVVQYGTAYDNTRRFSPTFTGFQKELAIELVERYRLHGKTILEIGCGEGDFISLLCEIGNNIGVGFDPAYVRHRGSLALTSHAGITFIRDAYSEKYAHYQGDFLVCQMTLEHLPQTAVFLQTIRHAIGKQLDTVVFFQIPNARYLLEDIAFWDIYYEHYAYFTPGSLGRLFRQHDFEILDLRTAYHDQYILLEARAGNGRFSPPHPAEETITELTQDISHFNKIYPQKLIYWRTTLSEWRAQGKKVILWGAGSKAVSFLTTLGITPTQLKYVVDVNPRKNGTYIVGTGQKIISPKFLEIYHPDIVIVMNPIYADEIRHILYEIDLTPKIITV